MVDPDTCRHIEHPTRASCQRRLGQARKLLDRWPTGHLLRAHLHNVSAWYLRAMLRQVLHGLSVQAYSSATEQARY